MSLQVSNGGILADLGPEQQVNLILRLGATPEGELDLPRIRQIADHLGAEAVANSINDLVRTRQAEIEIDEKFALRSFRLIDTSEANTIRDLLTPTTHPEQISTRDLDEEDGKVDLDGAISGSYSGPELIFDELARPDFTSNGDKSHKRGRNTKHEIQDSVIKLLSERNGRFDKGKGHSAGSELAKLLCESHGYVPKSVTNVLADLVRQGKIVMSKVSPESRLIEFIELVDDSVSNNTEPKNNPKDSSSNVGRDPVATTKLPNKSANTSMATEGEARVDQAKLATFLDKNINVVAERHIIKLLANMPDGCLRIPEHETLSSALVARLVRILPEGHAESIDPKALLDANKSLREQGIISLETVTNQSTGRPKVIKIYITESCLRSISR